MLKIKKIRKYWVGLAICISPSFAEGVKISSGTGFFINDSGTTVTNAHVVRGCESITVRSRNLGAYSASVITIDAKNDIAVLKLEKFTNAAPYPALNYRVRLGENSYVFGYPLTGVLSDTGNFTTGSVTSLQGIGNDSAKLQISTPIQPGNSGGPVLDDKGNLIGIVVGKLDALKNIAATKDIAQNVNFAIKSQILDGVLQAAGITTSMVISTQIKQPVDIAEFAQKISVHILCREKEDKKIIQSEIGPKTNSSPPGDSKTQTRGVPVQISSFGAWGVFAADTARGRVCYLVNQPKERLPAGVRRDPGYVFISTRPAERVYNEFSIVLGFPSADGSIGELTIGNNKFQLVSKGNSAWLKNPAEDKYVIELMKNNSTLKTNITSRGGNTTQDVYSLSGIDQALNRNKRECP